MVDSINFKNSNFRLLKDELLILVEISNKSIEIQDKFRLIKTKNNSVYLSLGKLNSDEILKNIEFIITDYEKSIFNPLLRNYTFHEYLDLSKFC